MKTTSPADREIEPPQVFETVGEHDPVRLFDFSARTVAWAAGHKPA